MRLKPVENITSLKSKTRKIRTKDADAYEPINLVELFGDEDSDEISKKSVSTEGVFTL